MEEGSRQETPGFTVKKKVDESWKNAVEKEKSTAFSAKPAPEQTVAPEPAAPHEEEPAGKPGFLYFISGLGMQTLAALGELPDENGIAGPPDLGQAKQLIEIIEMLARKTKGNLSPEEETSLGELLYQLRLKFVEKTRTMMRPPK